MPTIIVAQFAVIVSANRADFTGNRRSFGGSIGTVAGVAVAGCSGRCGSHFGVLPKEQNRHTARKMDITFFMYFFIIDLLLGEGGDRQIGFT